MKIFSLCFTVSIITGMCFLSTFAPTAHAATEIEKAPTERRIMDFGDADFRVSNESSIPTIRDNKIIIEMTSNKNSFYEGEKISIDASMRNNGASRPFLALLPLELFYDITVIGPAKKDLSKLPSASLRNQAGSLRSVNFGKQRVISDSVIISDLFDMKLSGFYQIKISKQFHLQGTKNPVTISSNVLSIKVTSTTLPKNE